MLILLTLGFTSFVVAFAITPLCRNLAIRWGLVDHPDNIRKLHTRPIPRIGGIPIFIACLVSFAVLLLFHPGSGQIVRGPFGVIRSLLPAAIIIFLTGLIDDLFGAKPWQKLGAQFVAATVAVLSGVQINNIAWHNFPSWVGVIVTVIWLIGCTNAFNLIDGMDGLAAGVGLVATTVTLIAALLGHNIGMAFAIIPIVGALLGFLRFNFSPATIFLGDSGSLLIGFLLGCYSVLWSQKSATILGMTAPVIALSIPLLDTGLAIIRRFLRSQPIFVGDHEHIHHKLLARGLTPRRVVISIYLLCGLCGALSLLPGFAHRHYEGPIVILLCIGGVIGVKHLRYAELEIATRLIFAGNFRRHVNAELQLSTFQDKLVAAITPDQCWEVLQQAYSKFGFNEIKFKLGQHLVADTTNGHHPAKTWIVRIKLSEGDYVNLAREFDTEAPPIMANFTDVIAKVLESKVSEMLQTDSVHRHISVATEYAELANRTREPLRETVPSIQFRRNISGR
jgi:UDP-GlcNAc:undecaprenyl-phosphate GlcNAc-1-phosphate transferase